VLAETSIKGWLPGRRTVDETVGIPADMPEGECEVAVGIVEPGGRSPAVQVAIEGRDADGWYPVSSVVVAPRR